MDDQTAVTKTAGTKTAGTKTAVTTTAGTTTVTTAPVPAPARTPGPRTPAEIEHDIEITRARLAGTIDELGYRVKPATIVKRTTDKAKGTVIDETGAPRTNRIAAIGGGVAAVIAFVVWRRRK